MLVQERFEGFTVADIGELDAPGVDRDALAEQLLRSTLDQVLRIGFFHADPHPGNIFVVRATARSASSTSARSAGSTRSSRRRSSTSSPRCAQRDVGLLRDGDRAGRRASPRATSPEELERALARLMADHVRPGGAVDPAVLQDLVADAGAVRHPPARPTSCVLSRALVTLDGTLRVLCARAAR